MWSVEIKQPQLQVSREYTPLPAGSASAQEGAAEEEDVEDLAAAGPRLRLLIRRMDGGEVSGYLASLRVGDTVEVRGPHLGFDVCRRIGGELRSRREGGGGGGEQGGAEKKVVFLAGGTGIAPALQAARALLGRGGAPDVEMEIVWANRRREDCVGCDGGRREEGGEKGAVVALLDEMRRRYGGRLRYACTVDEEGSFIDAGTITRATGLSASAGPMAGLGWWPFGGSRNMMNTAESRPAATIISDTCPYHSAKALVLSDGKDAPATSDGEQCQCKDSDGKQVTSGKNLLMVSGPDGFIARYVGAKVWGAGKERQGPVKGIVGELKRKYPSLADDWLVLKL
ncbi:hypothetical protein VTK56DRAFT_113 [Thermocarpiscus australiensis]